MAKKPGIVLSYIYAIYYANQQTKKFLILLEGILLTVINQDVYRALVPAAVTQVDSEKSAGSPAEKCTCNQPLWLT